MVILNDDRTYTGTAITASTCWPLWVETSTATATYTSATNQIWQMWQRAMTATATTGIDHIYRAAEWPIERVPRRRQMSAEERRLNEEYERATEAKYQEEKARRIEAEARAELLLQRLLTDEQRASLRDNRHFYLHSAGKKYRIDRGQTGNVKLVDESNAVVESYCIHPIGVPEADTMAAQKLMLEADPETFRRVANITYRNGRTRAGTPLEAVGR